VLTPDDFVMHRAFGGDVVRELEESWTPELQTKVQRLLLERRWAPDPSATDPLVARVGADTAVHLRETLSVEAFRSLHLSLTHSLARHVQEGARAMLGVALSVGFAAILLAVLWLVRGHAAFLTGFLLFGGLTLPAVWAAHTRARRARALRGDELRTF
jgi:hypothetical protein